MVLTFEYDASYNPSAPVIEIGVGPSDGTPARLTVRAMVDTGSDALCFLSNSCNVQVGDLSAAAASVA